MELRGSASIPQHSFLLVACLSLIAACGQPFGTETLDAPLNGGTGGLGGTGNLGGVGNLGGAGNLAGRGGGSGLGTGSGGTNAGGGHAGVSAGGAAGLTSCTPELLQDGGFDNGAAQWLSTSAMDVRNQLIYSDKDEVLTDTGVVPRSPHYLGWLGHVDNVMDELSQAILLPAGTLSVTVRGFVRVESTDTCDCDTLTIELEQDQGLHWDVGKWSSLGGTTNWMSFEKTIPLEALAGQVVKLSVRSALDDGVISDFFVDSLSVTALLCRVP